MQDVLIDLIQNIQATGGIITFSDGLSAPAADPTWIDLGDTVLKAHEALTKENIHIKLYIEDVDYSSKEAEDYA